jgi:hypothetical protein
LKLMIVHTTGMNHLKIANTFTRQAGIN